VPAVLPAQEGASTIEIKEREAWLTVDRHFRGRITCRIWCWLSHRLRGFKRRIARWIMHRTTGRITSGGDIESWSGFAGVPGLDDMRIFSR
jgi:hypothetical protein